MMWGVSGNTLWSVVSRTKRCYGSEYSYVLLFVCVIEGQILTCHLTVQRVSVVGLNNPVCILVA